MKSEAALASKFELAELPEADPAKPASFVITSTESRSFESEDAKKPRKLEYANGSKTAETKQTTIHWTGRLKNKVVLAICVFHTKPQSELFTLPMPLIDKQSRQQTD